MIKMTVEGKRWPNTNAYLELGFSGDFFYVSIKRKGDDQVVASLTGKTPEELSKNLESVGWEPLNSVVLAALELDRQKYFSQQ